jgi:hypothetical protein
MYADESGLLVFAAPSTSASLSKTLFLTDLAPAKIFAGAKILAKQSQIFEMVTKK